LNAGLDQPGGARGGAPGDRSVGCRRRLLPRRSGRLRAALERGL